VKRSNGFVKRSPRGDKEVNQTRTLSCDRGQRIGQLFGVCVPTNTDILRARLVPCHHRKRRQVNRRGRWQMLKGNVVKYGRVRKLHQRSEHRNKDGFTDHEPVRVPPPRNTGIGRPRGPLQCRALALSVFIIVVVGKRPPSTLHFTQRRWRCQEEP